MTVATTKVQLGFDSELESSRSIDTDIKDINESNGHTFPFGEQLKKVEQKDRTPKKAFVLGVYASAVHARWEDKNGKQVVSALAVASEPEIFWDGKNAKEIISSISIPEELGKLSAPKDSRLNGPSGRALDEKFLKPLHLERKDTWLCDLLPESRVNENQKKAIDAHYTDDLIRNYNLPQATIPAFDKTDLTSATRRAEILEELIASKADTLILLGDLPIKYFLNHFDKRFSRLVDFVKTEDDYGKSHKINIAGKVYEVIPLCHPRQAGRLRSFSMIWGKWHDAWMERNTISSKMQK